MTERDKLVNRITEGFKTLAKCQFVDKTDCLKTSFAAEDLLFAIYKAGVNGVQYTEQEKRAIGPLVPPALPGIGYKLSDLQSSFSSHSIDSIRIERSGLQFLIDVLKDFPSTAGDKPQTLEDTLKEFVEFEDIEGLDERLKTAEFDSDSDDSQRSAGLKAEIAKLPSNHWWFFN